MKEISKEDLNLAFLNACRDGYLDEVEILLKHKADIHVNNDEGLFNAVSYNQFDVIRYLLKSPQLVEHADIHAHDDILFRTAFKNNNMKFVIELIFELNIEKTTPIENYIELFYKSQFFRSAKSLQLLFEIRELNNNLKTDNNTNYKIELLEKLDELLCLSCEGGQIELAKFTLTSPFLSLHANINTILDKGSFIPIRDAFNSNNLDIAHYLLTSPELKEHANIHIENDVIFRNAFFANNTEILTLLIFDYSIEKTKHIEQLFMDFRRDPEYDKVVIPIENMFTLRELNNQLNKELPSKSKFNGKPKI